MSFLASYDQAIRGVTDGRNAWCLGLGLKALLGREHALMGVLRGGGIASPNDMPFTPASVTHDIDSNEVSFALGWMWARQYTNSRLSTLLALTYHQQDRDFEVEFVDPIFAGSDTLWTVSVGNRGLTTLFHFNLSASIFIFGLFLGLIMSGQRDQDMHPSFLGGAMLGINIDREF